jgi:hypothetical protein
MANGNLAILAARSAFLNEIPFGGRMMKIQFPLTITLLATSVAAAATNSHAQTQGVQTEKVVAGRIMSVHCDGRLLRKGAHDESKLLYPRDIALGLTAGDAVRCNGPGYLEVLVSEGTRRIPPPQTPFTIKPLPADPKYPEDQVIAESLTGYGVSGASRGITADSRILWPAENSAVVPEHFVIRWAPVPQKIVLSILSEAKDVTLWGPTEMDGEGGSFKSDAVSSALAAYKTKPGSAGLVLTLTLANSGDWEEVHFSLLNGREERELNAQLDFWRKHTDGLALRLGRGYSFSRRKLFAEAADEYDAALNSAPESRYLLEDAINANRLAGRPLRVKELQTRLASRPEAANP